MKFRHLPVLSNTDITHNFEQLQSLIESGQIGGGAGTPGSKGSKGEKGEKGESATGAVKTYVSFHVASVVATGTTAGGAALQSGEADEVKVTSPAGGSIYLITASIVVKNPGSKGGGSLWIDGEQLKAPLEETERNNEASLSVGLFHLDVTSPTKSTGGANVGWTVGASENELPKTLQGEPYATFLAEGSHTIELRLFNEDRSGEGKIKQRRLMVIGP